MGSRPKDKGGVGARLALAAMALALWALPAGQGSAGDWGADPSSWHLDMNRYAAGAHGLVACASCHQDQTQAQAAGATKRHPDPQAPNYLQAPLRQSYDYANCAPCHRLAFERAAQGAHAKALNEQRGKALAPEQAPAPTCGFCHDAHYQKARQDRASLGRRQVTVCGSCHPGQKATYLEGYHGQAAHGLGHPKAAFCTDCHGAHAAVSLKDKQAALAACLRCHPGATPSFAQFVVHPQPPAQPQAEPEKARRVAVIKAVGLVAAVLVLVLVGLFYGHSFLWLLRDLHQRIRRRSS